jgi:Tol biopolymer transport system component
MPLDVGAKLGPYEITGKLGAGGMGEVWKALDTRLNRTVAIKTSHEAFNARFEREARAVAALNHPNICQLYDVGPDYLVLEYVEGSEITTTDNVRKLLDLAIQIADGMAAAHAAGFIHRDLKPSNVLVTRDGRVKILDFGLAKNVEAVTGSAAPTITGSGLVAGTAAYMSPEQIRGSAELDARSDQFAFGLILYEMATGKRAFERASGVETLMAICRDDPEPLPASTPAPVRWIVERCLAKEPAQRYESSRDLYLELRSVRDHLADASKTQQSLAAIAGAPKRRRWIVLGALAGGVLLATIGANLLGSFTTARDPDLTYTPLSSQQIAPTLPVWSPDGKAIAFLAREKVNQPYHLYVRNLDSPIALPITPETNVDGDVVEWLSTGRIVFFGARRPVGLWVVSSVGGEPESFYPANTGDRVSTVSRDGSVVAVTRNVDGKNGVWIGSPPGSELRRYEPAPFEVPRLNNQTRLRFSPDGHQLLLMWSPSGTHVESWLLPYPPDPARPPQRVFRDGLRSTNGTPQFSWLPDSRHIVVTASPGAAVPDQLFVADVLSGRQRALSRATTKQSRPSVSPDGERIAFIEGDTDYDVVTLDLATAAVAPLIATNRSEEMPAWSSGSASLVYVTDRSGAPEIWLHREGDTDRPIVTARDFPSGPTQFFIGPQLSPDATRVIYLRVPQAGSGDSRADAHLWMSAVTGGAPVRVVRGDTKAEYPGSWSPDGNSYAYGSLGEQPGTAALHKVRTTGEAAFEVIQPAFRPVEGWLPVWSPTGDWILYPSGRLTLTSIDGTMVRDLGENALCTFARDGQRLFCLRNPEADGSRRLVSMNLEGADERTIGTVPAELTPASQLVPSLRLSLTPDGRSVTYSISKPAMTLWLMEGLSTVPLP